MAADRRSRQWVDWCSTTAGGGYAAKPRRHERCAKRQAPASLPAKRGRSLPPPDSRARGATPEHDGDPPPATNAQREPAIDRQTGQNGNSPKIRILDAPREDATEPTVDPRRHLAGLFLSLWLSCEIWSSPGTLVFERERQFVLLIW
jgi:hypothetical protein